MSVISLVVPWLMLISYLNGREERGWTVGVELVFGIAGFVDWPYKGLFSAFWVMP